MGDGVMMPLAGAGGNLLGKKIADWTGATDKPEVPLIKFETPNFVKEINGMLQNYLQQAMAANQFGTDQAVNTQRQYLDQATGSLNTNTQAAIKAADQYGKVGFAQSQALASPYSMAGSTGLDAYMDSLGLSRPKMGSGQLAQINYQHASAQPVLDQFRQLGNSSLTAPTAPTFNPTARPTATFEDISKQISDQQVTNYIKANTKRYNGEKDPRFKDPVSRYERWYAPSTANEVMTNARKSLVDQRLGQIQAQYNQAAQANQQQYNTALQGYNTQQGAYDKQIAQRADLIGLFNQLGLNPQTHNIAQAYQQGMFTKPAGK